MARLHAIAPFAIAAALASCGGQAPPPAAVAPTPSATPEAKNSTPLAGQGASTAAAPAAAPAEPPKPAAPTAVVKYTGLSHPESIVYDADADRYLVSNINGSPFDKDGNGFISALSPDGTITALKWIEGGKGKVKLDAPKGMAISKGILYVNDLTVVRSFDLKTGAPKGDVAIAGSTFLNDLAAAPDGKLYASDSGMKAGAGGKMEPTGTDAVYVIDKGKAKALAKGKELGGPNGVLWTDGGVLVVTLAADELYRLDDKGAKQDVTKLPAGHLDGLLALGDSLLVTSHDASAIYRGKLGGTFEVALAEQKTPADIGYDTKRGRLLVPHLMDDTVDVFELK